MDQIVSLADEIVEDAEALPDLPALSEEPRFLYADSDEGRALLLADLNRYIAEMDLRMPEH